MKPFFVTLVSNSPESTHLQYGHNTLTAFTNTLADPINLEDTNWWFCLHSVFCHNQFENDTADFVKVQCDLVTPFENQDTTIAIIARPKQHNGVGQHLYYEPVTHEHFAVNRAIISAITIHIQAEKSGHTALSQASQSLLAGQPSVVVLKFIPKPAMAPYVIRIKSQPSPNEVYQNNTASAFRAYLGSQYNFDPALGELEVALSSITYQPHFTMQHSKPLQAILYDPDKPDQVLQTLPFADFDGDTLEQYVEYINDTIFKKLTGSGSTQLITAATHRDADGIKRLRLYSKSKVVVELPYAVMFNMGERGFIPATGVTKRDAQNALAYKVYIAPGANNDYRFLAAPDPWAFFPDMAFIYCDFVQENLLGELNAPILRSIPITHKNFERQYITYSVSNPEFLSVSKYDLSNIFFELKDVTGNPLPFKNKFANVMITILLRVIPNAGNKRKRIL